MQGWDELCGCLSMATGASSWEGVLLIFGLGEGSP